MLLRIILVNIGFLLRTFRLRLPVTAQLIVNHVEVRHVRPLGMRELFADFLHVMLFDRQTVTGITIFGGATSLLVLFVELPSNISRTVECLSGEWSCRKIFGHPSIEP